MASSWRILSRRCSGAITFKCSPYDKISRSNSRFTIKLSVTRQPFSPWLSNCCRGWMGLAHGEDAVEREDRDEILSLDRRTKIPSTHELFQEVRMDNALLRLQTKPPVLDGEYLLQVDGLKELQEELRVTCRTLLETRDMTFRSHDVLVKDNQNQSYPQISPQNFWSFQKYYLSLQAINICLTLKFYAYGK